jgi:hypothetical protein
VNGEGDVHVGLGAAVVRHAVLLSWYSCTTHRDSLAARQKFPA